MPSFRVLTLLPLSIMLASSCQYTATSDTAMGCFQNSGHDFSKILSCNKQAETAFPGVEKRRFEPKSQVWTGHSFASPADWTHTVDIYIPKAALQ